MLDDLFASIHCYRLLKDRRTSKKIIVEKIPDGLLG